MRWVLVSFYDSLFCGEICKFKFKFVVLVFGISLLSYWFELYVCIFFV